MSEKKGSAGNKLLHCSFCNKSQHEVRKLIAGPSVFVCDECIDLCNDIIREEAQANAVRARETARTRRVESDRAEGTAQDARANLVSLKSGQDTQADLTTLRDGIARIQEALNTTSTAAAVINAEGQTTGTLVNVTA